MLQSSIDENVEEEREVNESQDHATDQQEGSLSRSEEYSDLASSTPDPTSSSPPSQDQSWSSPPSRPPLSTLTIGSPRSVSFTSPSPHNKVPAAGAGTRTGPRPVPRSSSALRHVSGGSKSRLSTFAALPEDGPSTSSSSRMRGGTGSSVQRQIDADARRKKQLVQQEDYWPVESDESDYEGAKGQSFSPAQKHTFAATARDSDEADSDSTLHQRLQGTSLSQGKRRSKSDLNQRPNNHGINGSAPDSTTEDERPSTEDDAEAGADNREGRAPENLSSPDATVDAKPRRTVRYAAQQYPSSSTTDDGESAPRRAKWHPRGPKRTELGALGTASTRSHSGLQTPGINFPPALNTPLEGSPNASSPEFEPRHRLEWQTMLESVLASEVLQSETKRITSVDAPDLSRAELMYRRWLDIRASLRGRGHVQGAVEAEEKRLKSGWPEMLKTVIQDLKSFRATEEERFAEREQSPAANRVQDGQRTLAELESQDPQEAVPESVPENTDAVYEEVGALLIKIDNAESQFPSLRKAIEVLPEWGDDKLQGKIEALRAWHNTNSLLRLRLTRLREWTGSETLQIDVPQKQHSRNDDASSLVARANGELEGLTFVEKILKEDSFKSTFESKTLSSVTQAICKARDTIKTFHEPFAQMALPSFAPEIVQLISFPLRLMESALGLRLDYAGKIKEPSLLIVDSLTDDVRSALDLALKTKKTYQSIMVPEPDKGWDLQPAIGLTYDETLRQALRFFFRLISFKLKGSVFFKETEILDNEWQFLSHAIAVIEGGDVIVAKRLTKIVNELFARIVNYFERELAAPSSTRLKSKVPMATGTAGAVAGSTASVLHGSDGISRGPALAGGLTKGNVHLTLTEKAKWIHAVFDNVRIRSRKLLGFAREVRNRLDNAAEYDLASLRPPTELTSEDNEHSGDAGQSSAASQSQQGMDLNAFMQKLITADYFLVYTESYEERGIYIIAEPSLHDKPEVIQDLLGRCMMKVSLKESLPTQADPVAGSADAVNAPGEAATAADAPGLTTPAATGPNGQDQEEPPAALNQASTFDPPQYLLLLTPRDPFMWTGRVMTHKIDPVEVALADRRLRLIADGPKDRLQQCKEHFYEVFAPHETQPEAPSTRPRRKRAGTSAPAPVVDEGPTPSSFPLDVVDEHMAHMADVQTELRSINKGVYMLSNSILAAVPNVRRAMERRKSDAGQRHEESDGAPKLGSEADELIQNCFSMATEQGFRSLPFIESSRLRGYMTLSLARLAIEWVGFICDDCVPTDRKTFKWAVAALENAVAVTRDENIFHLSEEDFNLMRAKVASCMALLISHFDILGARSSVAKAKEEQDRLEREKAERNRIAEAGINSDAGDAAERLAAAHKMVQGAGCAGPPPMLNRADSGMQAMEERWVQKMMEWDEARHSIEAEQRLIGRVLDDTRLEDQGLQFLASSSSRIQIRWQQGRFIGSGTFGTVYLAVNMDSGGLMAVKEIRFADISNNTSLYKNIKDEMNVMEMLQHPNIVDYYGIEVHRDKVYIFEEYCQGGSLAQLLEHGRIEDEAVIQVYTLQMLDGLVYLHSQGVVHRDIKPDNILLDHQGVIKFVDFGAAKILAKNSRTVQRSRKGFVGGANNMAGMVGPDGKPVGAAAVQSLQGTPMYMSPEVIKGESRGRRGAMDVWSLGCVVLEFATGRRPWSQLDNEWAIMFHIGMAQQHPPLPEAGQLSEMGIDFIRQCLNIDPYERPSAAEMREHPWIQELVDQMEAAANENEALDGTSTMASQGDFFSNNSLGTPTTNHSLSSSQPSSASMSGGSSGNNKLPFSNTDGLQPGDANGVAAMAFTPSTRSINSYIQSRVEPQE
ncbi:unnamed protein product [Sympodiomycopsis kandeliae]